MRRSCWTLAVACLTPLVSWAQVDPQLAERYFDEARMLCERDAGKLWGVSLCGPIAFADPVTRSIATNRPEPRVARPPALGYANAALRWGDEEWSTFSWPMLPQDPDERGRMLVHELFHRVQSSIGLPANDAQADHLETLDGRYWITLEWRALTLALSASGQERSRGMSDALAFRKARYAAFPEAAERERQVEMNEGLAQYTAIAVVATSPQQASAAARDVMTKTAQKDSLLRNFGYASGAAYGVLLDNYAAGWTRKLQAGDDLATLLAAAARVKPAGRVDATAVRYGGIELRDSEAQRAAQRTLQQAQLQRLFVTGPVLVLPRPRSASFRNDGMTTLAGVGTVYPSYNTQGEWGSLEAARALVTKDNIVLPASGMSGTTTLKGDGWTVFLAPGWAVRPGTRSGDMQIVRQ